MDYQSEHKGVGFSVHTSGPERKGYRWTGVIGWEKYIECQDRPLKSEEIMLQEGIDEAKRVIEAMAERPK